MFAACVGNSHEIRLVSMAESPPRQFVYAEHRFPITAVRALAANLFVSGDRAGELRLWHAPSGRLSDMILDAPEFVDSRLMTYSLWKRSKWSRTAFDADGSVAKTPAPRPGEGLSIVKQLRRGELEHTLKYRIDTNE